MVQKVQVAVNNILKPMCISETACHDGAQCPRSDGGQELKSENDEQKNFDFCRQIIFKIFQHACRNKIGCDNVQG